MPNWNHVDQDLPDDDMIVLIVAPELSDPVWLGYLEDGVWRTVEGGHCHPTHWMDLPEEPDDDC